MSEEKSYRLSKVASQLNIKMDRAVEFLASKSQKIDSNPNFKLNNEQFELLLKEFGSDEKIKKDASEISIGAKKPEPVVVPKKEEVKEEDAEFFIKSTAISETESPKKEVEKVVDAPIKLAGPKVLGKIDLDKPKSKKKEEVKAEPKKEEPKPVKKEEKPVKKAEEPKVEVKEEKPEPVKPEPVEAKEEKVEAVVETVIPEPIVEELETIKAKGDTLKGLTVLGKIELPVEKEKTKFKPEDRAAKKEKRKRKKLTATPINPEKSKLFEPVKDFKKVEGAHTKGSRFDKFKKEEPTAGEVQSQLKTTLNKIQGVKSNFRQKLRREKRSANADARLEKEMMDEMNSKILKVTEFISANDLASMMNVSVNQIISACMSLGLFVSINQRLDAETITFIAMEFGYETEFVSAEQELEVVEVTDTEEELLHRAPIVTIMGHVDHGKTSLLDYIRKANVVSGEAGGITQHIGAYDVTTSTGKKITFLDTPGHEAFTAMRARGAKVTDVVIIVVAADDSVMPQTKEAINHALAAGVPIIIALNKIDKPDANPDKVKEQLSALNILVEDWGGKYQCQEVSAKKGTGINELLEKVLLEAELLELKANPNKNATGTVIEASLDKGKGYVTTVLVQSGTLKVGDIILAGDHFGRVRAMHNHIGKKMDKAEPSMPVQVLGLPGAPQAGDKFNVMDTEREARELANKRAQLIREQSLRTKKHITLDEIGRRLAIGNFKELNIIVKGDVDGSIEALSDSLLNLSTDEIKVNIISKGVGQISESDVLLASASDAIIVAFQVRPSQGAKKLAEQEEIDIRTYSIIYDAINEIKAAMEGMLEPTTEEVVTSTIDIREVYKLSKGITVAGCMVLEGTVLRNNKVRLIRDGVVIHTGEISALKRFKDDVSEVKHGYECGLSIKNYSDLKVGDQVEAFEIKETKRKL
jgi:translation initiation factor IF-2